MARCSSAAATKGETLCVATSLTRAKSGSFGAVIPSDLTLLISKSGFLKSLLMAKLIPVKIMRTTALREIPMNHVILLFLPHLLAINCKMTSKSKPEKPTSTVGGCDFPSCEKVSWMMFAVPLPTFIPPKSEGTWPSRMTMAVAETNPVRTGTDMNSRRKPSLKRPMIEAYVSIIKATAKAIACGEYPSPETSFTISAVNKPMSEVGPTEISKSTLA